MFKKVDWSVKENFYSNVNSSFSNLLLIKFYFEILEFRAIGKYFPDNNDEKRHVHIVHTIKILDECDYILDILVNIITKNYSNENVTIPKWIEIINEYFNRMNNLLDNVDISYNNPEFISWIKDEQLFINGLIESKK